ncbi:MAG: hypothetical protein IPG45_15585 [Deltaproteobacteria bacterium]|nr:hypothetical protein [Deltaproteobacteria bacterium]
MLNPRRTPDLLHCLASVAVACLGPACNGVVDDPNSNPPSTPDAGFSSDSGFSPDAAPDPIQEVPLDLPELVTTATCSPLASGERVAAVSAEGHLWLATSSVGTDLRVLDGWSGRTVARYLLPNAALSRLNALGATTAMALADGQLLRLLDGERIEVSPPAALEPDADLCGDLADRGFVWSGGQLYQRLDDAWWRWTGLGPIGPGARLLDRDGECEGVGDGLWWASQGLAFWLLTPGRLSNPALLPNGEVAALRGEQALALRGGQLFLSPEPWKEVRFAHGAATQLATAGDYAFLEVGGKLLRFDGAEWLELTGPELTQLDALHPHAAGGLWTVEGNSVCHHSPTPMIQIRGLRRGEQRLDPQVVIEAQAQGATTLEVEVDGTSRTWSGTRGPWQHLSLELSVGWHQVRIRTTDRRAQRTVEVKILPTVTRSFEADVRPIYQTHCANQACHVSGSTGGAPDLTRYEDWLGRAARIEARVVRAQDMPPSASRRPDWGSEEIEVINEWLNGGLLP